MIGTILSVTLAMPWMPPMITRAVINAMIVPKTHCLSAKNDCSPPVMFTNCAATWLTWKTLPPPKEASTHITAKNPASTRPADFIPLSAKPFLR